MINRELLRARISFVRQGSEVERFHTKRMIQRNDIGHHSFHVAWLAYLMASAAGITSEGRLRIVLAALAHDLAEHVTGDMPGDFKREMGIREMFGQYEQALFEEIGFDFEGQLSVGHPIDEKRILKLADMLEGAFFCISEASMGNARVGIVFANFRAYIQAFAPFNEVEGEIVAYIDELWQHYGVTDAPGWSRTAHAARTGAAFAEDEPADPSKAGVLGVTGTSLPDVDDASDDRANPDLAVETPPLGSPASSLANQRQHGGNHYKDTPYQHWDFVLDTHQSYLQGCASKYVTRYKYHEDGALTNLEKAIHYMDKAQEAQNEGRLVNVAHCTEETLGEYRVANKLSIAETEAIEYIVAGAWGAARETVRELIRLL